MIRLRHQTFLETRQFASLDGLRALAIIAVIWHHTAGAHHAWQLLDRGFLGVDLFFVISGFLITTLLLRERRRTGDISLSSFYRRRALRILPAYAAMLLIACVIWSRHGNSSASIAHDMPFALLYISNLVPMFGMLSITWSLSAEEQFYLILPPVQKYAFRLFPWILAGTYIICILPPFGFFPHLPDFFRQTTFGPILLGVMLAYVLDDSRGWAIVREPLGHPVAPIAALGLVLLSCSYPGMDISGWPRMVIHASLLVLVASTVVREDHALRPLLTWTPIRRIGVVSYGIYLYHMYAHWPVSKVIHSPYGIFVGTLVLSYLFAELSYRLLERRFLRLKRKHRVTVLKTPQTT